jgi:large subunit ribosomal protein L23
MAIDAKHFHVVRKPILTEKSVGQQLGGVYAFEVAAGASKLQIKDAVEAIWNVKVNTVRTATMKGEERRNRHGSFVTAGHRKAYVKLKDGYEIEIV